MKIMRFKNVILKPAIFDFLGRGFYVDLRSLALMRIAVSIVLLFDLLLRMSEFRVFYTDQGIFPTSLPYFKDYLVLTIHALSGSWQYELSLFLLQIFLALMLLVGWQAKIAAFLSWVLYLSLFNRNPDINFGADYLLLLTLLIGAFIPWHLRFSVDSLGQKVQQNKVITLATTAYLLHVFALYFFTGAFKINELWLSGRGLFHALAYLPYQQPLGYSFLQFSAILGFLNYTVIPLEILSAVLIILPFKNSQLRILVLFSLLLLHTSIRLTLGLGIFSFVAVANLLGILPTDFWNFFSKSNYKEDKFVSLKQSRISYLLLLIIIYVLFQNFAYLFNIQSRKNMNTYGLVLRLPPRWDMYAEISPNSYWVYAIGTTRENVRVDYLTQSFHYDLNAPSYSSPFYKNQRWKKLMYSLMTEGERAGFAKYICATQQKLHPELSFKTVELIAAGKRYSYIDNSYSPIRPQLFHKEECRDLEI